MPTFVSQGMLISAFHLDLPNVTSAEVRELMFRHLYYIGMDAGRLRQALDKSLDDKELSHFCRGMFFGKERVLPILSSNPQPITQEEIDVEVGRYEEHIASFAREHAANPTLSYVVTPTHAGPDFVNLDRWYERDTGERIGDFTLYRVRLRE